MFNRSLRVSPRSEELPFAYPEPLHAFTAWINGPVGPAVFVEHVFDLIVEDVEREQTPPPASSG